MKRLLVLLGSLCAVSTALATTYVRVEKDGTKTYSDRPIPGGQPVELQSAQTYSAPPAANSMSPSLPLEQQLLQEIDDFRYDSCGITPANDETFTNPPNVPIQVQLTPAKRPTDEVTLSVDGKVVGTNSYTFVLQPAERGTHQVQVTVKTPGGRVLCSATSVFHVHRPSVNLPSRR
jgi:hypothetical protein